MGTMELGEVQLRFAELVWHYAPLPSGELVKICQRELNWKKPTTYTVLRKLCEKGLFKNEDGLVSVVMSQEEFYAAQSEPLTGRCPPLSRPLPPARSCRRRRWRRSSR